MGQQIQPPNRDHKRLLQSFFLDCDKGAKPTWHDHRLVAQLARNLDGHHPDQRSSGHLLALVGLRDLQQHQERQGRRPQVVGEFPAAQ